MKYIIISVVIVSILAEPPRFRPARFGLQRQELAPTTTDSPIEPTTDASGPYLASGWKPSGAPFTLPIDTTPTPTDTYGPPEDNGPYPPSGWKPQEAFELPNDQSAGNLPDNTYGAPQVSEPYPPSGWKPEQAFKLSNDHSTGNLPDNTYGAPQVNGPYPPSGWKPQGQVFTFPQEQAKPVTSYGAPDTTYGVPDKYASTEVTTDNPEIETLVGPIEVQKSIGTYYVLLPNGQLQRIEFVSESDIQNMKYTARLQLQDRAPLFVFGP